MISNKYLEVLLEKMYDEEVDVIKKELLSINNNEELIEIINILLVLDNNDIKNYLFKLYSDNNN